MKQSPIRRRVEYHLEDIGFYTLSDERALSSSTKVPLQRCELLLTPKCNFRCLYCRGLAYPELTYNQARNIVEFWLADGVKNIRFSGGEPMLYPYLRDLVKMCKRSGVNRVAISTNGSAYIGDYLQLIDDGVNDLSISLDGGCCALVDKMAGVSGKWDSITDNIKTLSSITYVTVGMVFTEDNIDNCLDSVLFASSLGVSDIRVIPSAQYNKALLALTELPDCILDTHPILKYRINNIRRKHPVRGIDSNNKHKCSLVLDDMAVAGDYHFPCIIWLREGGKPIGRVSDTMRDEREKWMWAHQPSESNICRTNCLDVCVAYNSKAGRL